MDAGESSSEVIEAREGESRPTGSEITLWVSIVWALSPAAVVLVPLLAFGRSWPYLSWLIFFAGLVNMYAWSAIHLRSRVVEHWEIKAVPLTLGMLGLNLMIAFGLHALVRAVL